MPNLQFEVVPHIFQRNMAGLLGAGGGGLHNQSISFASS